MKAKLTPHDRNKIAVAFHKQEASQNQLAKKYGVCRRTIQRVLTQKGIIATPMVCTTREQRILEVVRKYQITPTYLAALLERDQDRRICIG